jgi:hypothetical protein
MTIELIYDADCPNVIQARANLMKALATARSEAGWTEWDRSAADSPQHVRGYGSPTILVRGKDVAGEPVSEGGPCCRLYRTGANSWELVPSVAQIAEALHSHGAPPPVMRRGSSGWKALLATMPGIGFAFMPKLACPACWPAYAGLLSSLGLGFLLEARYLLPVTSAFLALAIGALAFRARTRRGYGPFGAGLAGSAVVLVGKFSFDSNVAMYGGIALLLAASVWNSWPVRNNAAGCPACVSDPSSIVSLQNEVSS